MQPVDHLTHLRMRRASTMLRSSSARRRRYVRDGGKATTSPIAAGNRVFAPRRASDTIRKLRPPFAGGLFVDSRREDFRSILGSDW